MGRIEVLQPEDEEPFILASVKSGQTRTSVDTYMYKAGVSRLCSSATVIIAVCVSWLSTRGGLEREVSALLVETAYSQIQVHARMPDALSACCRSICAPAQAFGFPAGALLCGGALSAPPHWQPGARPAGAPDAHPCAQV